MDVFIKIGTAQENLLIWNIEKNASVWLLIHTGKMMGEIFEKKYEGEI